MPRVTVVRYQTSPEAADENQRLVEEVYAELAANDVAGLRYMTLRLADGVSFLHISMVDGEMNPLSGVAAFAAFQADIATRCVQQPAPSAATVVGAHGF
jgi:hypothetical protein